MTTTDQVENIGRETAYYVPGKLVVAVMAVVAVPVYTHFFEAEDLGRFDLALKAALFAWTLCILWLNNVMLRFYPAYVRRNEQEQFLAVMIIMKWVGLGLGVALLLGLWAMGPERLVGSFRNLLAVSALAFAGRSSLELGLSLFAAKRKPIAHSVASAANAVAKLALGVGVAVGLEQGVAGLVWAAGVVPLVVYFAVMRRHFGSGRLALRSGRLAIAREVIGYGTPICLVLVFNFFLANGDRYILKILDDDRAVGVYMIGHFLADHPIQFVYATFMLAAFPAVAHTYESGGRKAAEKLVPALIRLYLLVAVPTCVFLAVLAHPVVFALARGETRASFVVVPWVAFAALLLGLSHYYTIGLYIAKRPALLLAATVLATALNAVANWYLVPRHGFYGCGMARAVSNGAMLLLTSAFSFRFLRIRFPLVSLLRITAAAAVAGAMLFILKGRLAEHIVTVGGEFCAGFALYGILLFAFGEISRGEIRRLLAALLCRAGRG